VEGEVRAQTAQTASVTAPAGRATISRA